MPKLLEIKEARKNYNSTSIEQAMDNLEISTKKEKKRCSAKCGRGYCRETTSSKSGLCKKHK